MPELSIHEVAQAMGGTIEIPGGKEIDCRFSHYHFDTRLVTEPGTLFFALKSESGDGHRFVHQLQDKPGTCAVVNTSFDSSCLAVPLIRVGDPINAAQLLAVHVRNTYRHLKYVGITGSAGKTTTKEFIFHVLSHRYGAYRSYKNWNNWIGMPFSILNMSGQEGAAVFELAMSNPGIGEIDLLARILRPDVAVILNVFPAHLEYLKTIENIAQAKCEILNYLDSDSVAFINGDSDHLTARTRGPHAPRGRKIHFGRTASNTINDIRLKAIHREADRTVLVTEFYGIETRFETTLVNPLHVENLFVAIMVAQHLGMKNFQIQDAIRTIAPLSNRGHIASTDRYTVINETYNSNPEALKRTLEWVNHEFAHVHEKIAVVGDMLELGDNERAFHHEVGQFVATLNYDRLVTVGTRSRAIAQGARESGFDPTNIHSFDESGEAGNFLKALKPTLPPGSVLLFKGSRGIQLEHALQEFLNA
ncbi:MAG: UDP-N-acetylmuramoyl-tripeptide--D-alanyl-D-alanine ligase [Candidatus Omnitrophota bacterium]